MENTTTSRSAIWRARYDEWKASGLRQREWCHRNDYNEKTFGYWARKFRKEETGEGTGHSSPNECYEFTFPMGSGRTDRQGTLAGSMKPELAIQVKDYLLYINPGVSQGTLRTVMEVLADA